MTEIIIRFFRNLARSFMHSLSGLPWVVVVLLILALILIILIVILTIRGMRKAALKAPGALPPDQVPSEKLPPFGGWVTEVLSRKGFFRVSSLSLSFLKALEFLKQTLDTYNYKYQLPWYLLIGAENSGKSTLMEGAELNLPFGRQDFGLHHGHPDCQWWFLNRGVILDIRGNFLMRQAALNSNEKGWRSLLILLARYRAARPINGVILTIPATELYGRQRLSVDEISARAEYLAQSLAIAQNGLGLRLPIYVLITKTDTVPGFQSFCSEIPTRNRHNMIGWSSPYSLDTAYTQNWMEEAFSAVQENLHQLRLEIFAEGGSSAVRDGVFVFPSELMTIKDSLSVYLNHVFKNTSYQQSMTLRGIYFCGDSGLTPLKILDDQENDTLAVVGTVENLTSRSESAGLQLMAASNESVKRKVFFVEDLITQKVLQEPGLAIPQKKRILSVNRILNVTKIATAVFVTLGSYGLFNAYDNFIRSRDYIMPVLGKMNNLLHDLRNLKLNHPNHSNELFDVYARELIEMMDQLNQTDFFSIFVPASWFSPLHSDLHETLKVSYQQVVIRTIYIDLLLKARDLLHLRPGLQDQSSSLVQLLMPLSSPEYLLVKRYVEGLATLQDKFNNLKGASSFSDLNDLVIYTFGGQLPKQFAEQYHRFQGLLNNTIFPPIDLKPYQALARETLTALYQNFLNVLFNANAPNTLPNRLNGVLKQLSQQDNQHLPEINTLRQFSLELAQAMPTFGEMGKTWFDKDFFNPSKDFDVLLDKIDGSNLFGKEFTQYLVDQTAVGFSNLQQYLRPFNQLLSDQPITSLVNAPVSQNYVPSQGLITLSKSLIKLFSEPYMGASSGRSFSTITPPGKVIHWDSKLIQLAYDMCKRYDEFALKEISTFPPLLHENLKLLARQSLQANVIDLIARSQSFIDLPANLSQGLAAEEVLRSKVGDAGEVAPKFAKLLEILNQDSVGFSFIELRDLLVSTSYWLLSQVEIMLENLTPYTMHDITFDWWNGQAGASLGGYSAHDLEDLKTYLELQRQQIQNMALSYAKPLVAFLTVPAMAEATGDKALLNKWRRIVTQVEAYGKKQPGNSISVLEDFILKVMNVYDLKTIFSMVPLADIQQSSGDYFLEIVRQLKKAALSRAEIMRRQQSIEHYKELVSIFNQDLKNKFPFVGANLSLTMSEADPEDIRAFFRKFDAFGGSVQEIANQIYQLGPMAGPAVDFLKQMQVLKDFFEVYLKGQGEGDLPTFDFKIDFRANRNREAGGDMIVDWTIKPDEDTMIHKNEKIRQGRWIYGNPVSLSFRWPQGDSIPLKPVKDQTQSLLSIDEKTATFTYTGRWALFWLLRLHMANKTEYSPLQDPNPHVLKFMIPTSPADKAVVYNVLTLMLPSATPKKLGKLVRMPVFPVLAPDLSDEVLGYADKAVLTEGVIKAAKLETDENPPPAAAKAKTDKPKADAAPAAKVSDPAAPAEPDKKEEEKAADALAAETDATEEPKSDDAPAEEAAE